MKFDSPEEEKEYFDNALENRRNIKGEVTFQPPQFYNNTFWNAASGQGLYWDNFEIMASK